MPLSCDLNGRGRSPIDAGLVGPRVGKDYGLEWLFFANEDTGAQVLDGMEQCRDDQGTFFFVIYRPAVPMWLRGSRSPQSCVTGTRHVTCTVQLRGCLSDVDSSRGQTQVSPLMWHWMTMGITEQKYSIRGLFLSYLVQTVWMCLRGCGCWLQADTHHKC